MREPPGTCARRGMLMAQLGSIIPTCECCSTRCQQDGAGEEWGLHHPASPQDPSRIQLKALKRLQQNRIHVSTLQFAPSGSPVGWQGWLPTKGNAAGAWLVLFARGVPKTLLWGCNCGASSPQQMWAVK